MGKDHAENTSASSQRIMRDASLLFFINISKTRNNAACDIWSLGFFPPEVTDTTPTHLASEAQHENHKEEEDSPKLRYRHHCNGLRVRNKHQTWTCHGLKNTLHYKITGAVKYKPCAVSIQQHSFVWSWVHTVRHLSTVIRNCCRWELPQSGSCYNNWCPLKS